MFVGMGSWCCLPFLGSHPWIPRCSCTSCFPSAQGRSPEIEFTQHQCSQGTAPSVTLPSPKLSCSPRQPAPPKFLLYSLKLWPRGINYIVLFIELNVLLLHCATALCTYFFVDYIHSIFIMVFWFGNWKTDGLQNWGGTIVAITVETDKFCEIMLKFCN